MLPYFTSLMNKLIMILIKNCGYAPPSHNTQCDCSARTRMKIALHSPVSLSFHAAVNPEDDSLQSSFRFPSFLLKSLQPDYVIILLCIS